MTHNQAYLKALKLGRVAVQMNDGSYEIMVHDTAVRAGHEPWILTGLLTERVWHIGRGYADLLGERLRD